nr:unnamed protein product [Digitaria exilis]
MEMTHMFPREGASSSSTSMSSQRSETDDDKMIAMVLSEEYAKLDGAMAKRLTNLTSIPHVPRINTYFPTYSDATMDHYRLLDRLNAYGLFEVRVAGDGNCQFRALSDQLYRSPDYHKHVRKEIVKQVCESLAILEILSCSVVKVDELVFVTVVPLNTIFSRSGEWGDHVTLQAAADKFAAKICLLTSFRDTCFVEIVPQYQTPQREIWLSFWSEVHYNSLYDARALRAKSAECRCPAGLPEDCRSACSRRSEEAYAGEDCRSAEQLKCRWPAGGLQVARQQVDDSSSTGSMAGRPDGDQAQASIQVSNLGFHPGLQANREQQRPDDPDPGAMSVQCLTSSSVVATAAARHPQFPTSPVLPPPPSPSVPLASPPPDVLLPHIPAGGSVDDGDNGLRRPGAVCGYGVRQAATFDGGARWRSAADVAGVGLRRSTTGRSRRRGRGLAVAGRGRAWLAMAVYGWPWDGRRLPSPSVLLVGVTMAVGQGLAGASRGAVVFEDDSPMVEELRGAVGACSGLRLGVAQRW